MAIKKKTTFCFRGELGGKPREHLVLNVEVTGDGLFLNGVLVSGSNGDMRIARQLRATHLPMTEVADGKHG